MSEWEVSQPLDYSATGDDIDSASQKIIATFADVYDKLNRLRNHDAGAGTSVGDASAYSFKVDTSVTPAAILCRNGDNSGWVQIGAVAKNMGITADDVGAITGIGLGKLSLGAEANLPANATTHDMYFAYDTGRLYMYLTGAWRVFLSLRFEDLLGVGNAVIERNEVAANGANKIPRLNSVGEGEFNITGSAAKIGDKPLYLPELRDGCVLAYSSTRDRWEIAERDDITNADVSTTGEADKIVKTDSEGKAHVNITGSAAKIAAKTIDLNNLQDGDVLVYDATTGTFKNKQGAVVNAQGVVEANVSGSAQKWAGKAIQTVNMSDGQILVWSESLNAFINRNQSAVGNARALSLRQDGVELANYNGDEYRAVNIITPHLRAGGQSYSAGDTCFSKNMPLTTYLECVTAGVAAAVEPDFSGASIGDVVTDGGAEWKVCGYVNTKVTDTLDNRLTTAESDIDTLQLGYRQPSTAQSVGDIRYHATLPAGWYLECTTAGTTGSGALTITSPTVGGTVSDGTVTWTVRKNASTQDLTAYLPLSGGQMTGYVYGDSGKALYLKAAPQSDGGPSLALYGLDIQDSQPIIGGFELVAMGADRTTTKSLCGYNNGGLTWDGNSLDKSAVVAESLGQTGYRKYASGKIEQWGQISISNDTEVTLPISFQYSSSYQVFIGAFNTSTYSYGAQPVSASSFKAFTSSPQAIGVRYFAIGI